MLPSNQANNVCPEDFLVSKIFSKMLNISKEDSHINSVPIEYRHKQFLCSNTNGNALE